MGDVRAELQSDVSYEQPEQPAAPGEHRKKDEVEQGPQYCQRTPAPEAWLPAIWDRSWDRLNDHRNDQTGKSKQAQVGVLFCIGDIVKQDCRQEDRVDRIPHERQPHPVGIEDEQLQET